MRTRRTSRPLTVGGAFALGACCGVLACTLAAVLVLWQGGFLLRPPPGAETLPAPEVPAAGGTGPGVDPREAGVPVGHPAPPTIGTTGTEAGGALPAESRPGSPAPGAPAKEGSAGEMLASRALTVPVEGITADQLVRSFTEERGSRAHEAIDILAPRGTPVLAVEDGTIARLFLSDAGGITIYQFDPGQEFCYYYAHLDRYAEGLAEGQPVRKGQVLGYVGTSGNAQPDTPHLHFAIYRLTGAKRWWEGVAIDPYDVFR